MALPKTEDINLLYPKILSKAVKNECHLQTVLNNIQSHKKKV